MSEHPCNGIPEDQIEMLNEPLLTDDGFLNPVCVAELSAAIKNMPPTYERLANNPEWSRSYCTTDSDFVAYLARWAVAQNRTLPPPGMDNVLRYVRACLRETYLKPHDPDCDDPMFHADLSLCDVNRILWEILADNKQFNDWNDKDAEGMDGWFIDLHALLHNVCVSIRNDRRHYFAFDRKFERENGGLLA